MIPACEVCDSPADGRLCAGCADLLSLYILTQAIAEDVTDGAE